MVINTMAIDTLEEKENKAVALAELGEKLAQAKQWAYAEALWAEASTIIDSLLASDEKERALAALGKAFARGRQWERAVHSINAVEDHWQKAWALSELAGELAQAHKWEEAEDIISAISAAPELKASALAELAKTLAESREYKHLLHMVQKSWLEADTREEVILLLPVAYGFVSLKPEIGIAFYGAFAWVNDFLKESGATVPTMLQKIFDNFDKFEDIPEF